MNFLLLGLNGGMFGMTMLRETPEFRRNSGGYPVWSRELIGALSYPSLALLLLATFSQVLPGFLPRSALSWFLWGLAIIVLGCSMLLMVANNVENLVEGRPLHYHPQ